VGDITNGSTQTSSTLDVLVSDYAAYIYNNKITGTSLSKSGDVMTLSTNTGSYLILPWKSDSLYAVMVGNLNYKEENGEWVKQNSTIVAKASKPYINASVGKIGQKEASYIIGEEYTYYVEAALPLFPTNSKITFKNGPEFSVALGKGITFQGIDNLEMNIGNTKLSLIDKKTEVDGKYFTSTATIMNGDTKIGSIKITNKGRAIELGNLTYLDIYLNDSLVTNQKIRCSFKTKLNEKIEVCRKKSQSSINASTNFNLFPSNVMFTGFVFPHAYDENWKLYADENWIDITESIYVFTYKLQLNKHVLGNPTKKLGGAVFEIYSDASLTKKIGSVTTDDDGFAEFSGLGEGKYYLKEVTAPTGYSLLKRPTEIEIKYDESLIDSETGEYCGPTVDIANQKISALPITGGMGTILYTLVGILLIGSAGIGMIYYKRKNKLSV